MKTEQQQISDTRRLDFLQSGHCLYAICTNKYAQGYEFEIDGQQEAPRFQFARDAIDNAVYSQEDKENAG